MSLSLKCNKCNKDTVYPKFMWHHVAVLFTSCPISPHIPILSQVTKLQLYKIYGRSKEAKNFVEAVTKGHWFATFRSRLNMYSKIYMIRIGRKPNIYIYI